MDHLDKISVGELQQTLENIEEKTPTQRLITAIAYKNGITQTELAEWYDVERRTIYSWLKRLDTNEPLEKAVTDDHRSGRKRKLSKSQQQAFEQTVNEPPTVAAVGDDTQTWSPELVQQHLKKTYDVEYSLPSCRRLLKEAQEDSTSAFRE